MKKAIQGVCVLLVFLFFPIAVSAVGNISVNSLPTGAAVLLEGINTGTTTPTIIENVSGGSHIILLRLTGYQDYTHSGIVNDNATSTVSATLAANQAVSAITVYSITVDPPTYSTPGTSVTVQFRIDTPSFPSGEEIRLFTDLDNPTWTYSIVVNGVENLRPVMGGNTLAMSGFELSYKPSDEVFVRVNLEGTAPIVSQTSDQVIIRVSDVDSNGNITMVYTNYYRQVALTNISTTTGVYRPRIGFYLKTDNLNTWNPLTVKYLAWDNAAGDLPIAGDWNADGRTETGVYRPGVGFYLKMDNGSTWTPSTDVYLAWDNAAGDLPIAGDWNADRRTETGVYRPGIGFYLKMDDGSMSNPSTSLWNPSTDRYLAWDNAMGDLPITGKWNANSSIVNPIVIPIISGVSPSQGAINDVLSLTINGQNFKDAVKVSFIKGLSEIVCTSPVSADSTKIFCNLDLKSMVTGDWDVTVLNIDGQQKGTWDQKFHVLSLFPPPTFTKIVPDQGTAGTALSITALTGTNFQSGATVTLMKLDNPNITATNVNVQSSTLITCTFAPLSNTTAGVWDLVITNPDGQYVAYANIFSIHSSETPPDSQGITSISPTSTFGIDVPMMIIGTDFQQGFTAKLTKSTGSTVVVEARSVAWDSPTQVRAWFTLPTPKQPGTYNVVVTNPDGTTRTLVNGFEVK